MPFITCSVKRALYFGRRLSKCFHCVYLVYVDLIWSIACRDFVTLMRWNLLWTIINLHSTWSGNPACLSADCILVSNCAFYAGGCRCGSVISPSWLTHAFTPLCRSSAVVEQTPATRYSASAPLGFTSEGDNHDLIRAAVDDPRWIAEWNKWANADESNQ